jgi:hypothetical protein
MPKSKVQKGGLRTGRRHVLSAEDARVNFFSFTAYAIDVDESIR